MSLRSICNRYRMKAINITKAPVLGGVRPFARAPHAAGKSLRAVPVVRVSTGPTETAAPAPETEKVEVPSNLIGGDPWKDEPWASKKWTVYRGTAYDLTPYLDRHPGGRWLLNLAIQRDCTALFESSHLRPEVAAAMLNRLPLLHGFPIDAVPRAPYPNDSELYRSIRKRVREEVFKGQDVKGAHRSGSEGAALTILSYTALAYVLYATLPNALTGALLGLGGAWIGLTVQHCGNHGAMSTNQYVNGFMGLMNDLTGGSSLMWRYHHQVSHHIHCNDDALDEDVFSSLPFLRFDPRLPREWFHKYQHIYMWLTFPFLQIVFQYGDWKALFENRTQGATLYGAQNFERATLVLGKLAHYSLLVGLPLYMHGAAGVIPGAMAYIATQGIVLAATFAVSHNLAENKPATPGLASAPAAAATTETLYKDISERDWAVQQVQTSSNWGGAIGNFFTGGLNLQIEHHLFPAVSFMHYPAIAKIVREECEKRDIEYVHYDTLPQIIDRFNKYMAEVGEAPYLAPSKTVAEKTALLARV